jgi:hypothetical protein
MFEKRKAAKLAADQTAVRHEIERMIGVVQGQEQVDTPLVLAPGEIAIYVITSAGLFEPRRGPGHWTGASSGFSVPTGAGTRFRIGATHGHYVAGTEAPTIVDTGTVSLTNRRVEFQGREYTREWDFKKLVGIQHFSNQPWTAIQVSNREKTSGFTYKGVRADFVRSWLEIAAGLYEGKKDEILRQLNEQLDELPQRTDVAPSQAGQNAPGCLNPKKGRART